MKYHITFVLVLPEKFSSYYFNFGGFIKIQWNIVVESKTFNAFVFRFRQARIRDQNF